MRGGKWGAVILLQRGLRLAPPASLEECHEGTHHAGNCLWRRELPMKQLSSEQSLQPHSLQFWKQRAGNARSPGQHKPWRLVVSGGFHRAPWPQDHEQTLEWKQRKRQEQCMSVGCAVVQPKQHPANGRQLGRGFRSFAFSKSVSACVAVSGSGTPKTTTGCLS